MNTVIDTRVSTRMRDYLLANRRGKLHHDQRREVVTEPLITILVLMVPAIILLRSFLLTLLVGWLWMVGVGVLVVGGVMLFLRSRRYARISVHFGVFRAPEKLPSVWMFWKPVTFTLADGKSVSFKHSLTPDKRLQPNQEYIAYYITVNKEATLLSFAPTDHLESHKWWPEKAYK
jgi:hypothetical protein